MIFTAGLAAVLSLLPLLNHYLPAARYLGLRDYVPMYYAYNPYFTSWFNVGASHWIWGWTAELEPFRSLDYPHAHSLGFGLITPLACAAGLYVCRQRPICRLAACVILATVFATTFLPGRQLAVVATGVACYCLACLFREFDAFRERTLGLATLLTLLLVVRFPNVNLQVLISIAIIFCSMELVRTRGRPECQVVPGIALALFCLKMFSLDVLWMGLYLVAAVAVPVGYFLVGQRRDVAVAAVLIVVFFATAVTFLDNPVLALAALGAALGTLVISTPCG